MSSDSQQPTSDDAPTLPHDRVIDLISGYAPALVLIAWTVIPLSLALVFADSLIGLLCLYPVLCPFIWIAIAKWEPDKIGSTIGLGIIGHLLLVTSLWFILDNSGMGNNVGFDFVGLLVILALLVFSLLGSIITITFFGVKGR